VTEMQKRRPVTHRHPAIAATIHILRQAGGGPLPAVVIFRRAHDRGLLAATAYNTLRGRLSQHQQVEDVVVLKTDAGYMLRAEGEPSDTPEKACAPNRPALPVELRVDPLAVIPTPRARPRRRKPPTRVRDIRVAPAWLAERKAPVNVLKWVRLTRWRWQGDEYPTVCELMAGWLPVDVMSWLLEQLPLEADLRERLTRAAGHAERGRILQAVEGAA